VSCLDFLLLLNLIVAGVSDAAAYLDPGTGSIIFPSIIAVVATGLAVFATAWKNVVSFFNGMFNSNIKKHSELRAAKQADGCLPNANDFAPS
jgi:hypothetical protein